MKILQKIFNVFKKESEGKGDKNGDMKIAFGKELKNSAYIMRLMLEEEKDDEVTKELYDDVNVNLGNENTEMTNADQGASEQQNVSQELGFEQVEEDAHVTLTLILDIQKANEPVQSSSVSSDFTSKLLNLENPSPADNKIASLLETSARHATEVPENTSGFTTNIPPLPSVTNLEKDLSKTKQVDQQEAQDEKNAYIELVDTSMRALIKEEVNTQLPQILPQAVSDFANPVIEKNVTESVEAAVLTRSSSQPTSTYEAAASLSEFELTKILIDKMEKNKSYDKADYKKKLYDALVESYNTDKDLFDSYGEVFSLKRSRDEKDKDRDPSAGSDRGTKRRKSSKDVESSRDSRSKEKKSSSTSKDASQSQHKSFGKSAHAEEPSHTVEDSGMQQDQEFAMRNNDEQPADKEVTKADWFKKPERPPTPDPDWSKRQQVDFRPPQTWISQVARAEEPPTSFDELNDTSFDFSAFVMNRLKILNLTQEILVGPAFNLLKGTCKSIMKLGTILKNVPKQQLNDLTGITLKTNHLEYLKGGDLSRRYTTSVTKTKAATYNLKWIKDLVPNLIIAVTRLSIMKKYDYSHLEEIEVRREDQKLYKFREGDFPRFRLQDIEDMLLLLVQKKLTNLTIDERYDLNVALRMFTRRIVIQRRVEDLQLGVESYQKKLNLTKPVTFSDGTLDDFWSALNDIAKGIRMEYLPKRKWSDLDKRRARVMIQDIDKKLFERRFMRNLEKFVGGREYGNDIFFPETMNI
ncbi:hypothetical protein Tco_1456201 [Tanacetum coccineum]